MEASRLGREVDVVPEDDPTASAGRHVTWAPADPGPLGLAAFAGTTFVLSLINAGLVGSTNLVGGGLLPLVAALALAYGGAAQLIAGIWEFRTGNTFGAVAFCSYGAFWISFYFVVQAAGIGRQDRVVQRARPVPVDVGDLHRLHVHRLAADVGGGRAGLPAAGDHVHRSRHRQLGAGRDPARHQRHDQARRIHRDRHGGRGVVRVLCGGDQLDLRSNAPAGLPAESLTTDLPPRRLGWGTTTQDKQPRICGQAGRRRDPPAPRRFRESGKAMVRNKERLAMADTASTSEGTLEQQLEEMLEIEKFEPPASFREHALLNDPAVYDEAEADWKGWWVKQAKNLSWFKEPTKDVDDSNPPFYKWFEDGKINASYNCVDRHVEAGKGDKVAYHWRGEEGEERDVTYADLHRDVQRFANALKDLGIEKGDVVGIYLPMIPEVVVAMLACARIGAPHNVVFGGFSAGFGQGADGVLRGQGADHRRRRAAQGQDRADQAGGRRRDGRSRVAPAHHRRQVDRHRLRDEGRAATSGTTRSARPPIPSARQRSWTPSTRCTSCTRAARPRSRRAILHTTGGYLTGSQRHAQLRVRPQARRGRLLVRRRRRLGHRPLLHRLRAAVQRSHLGDVGGRARLPAQGDLVGDRRALRGRPSSTRRRRRSAPA